MSKDEGEGDRKEQGPHLHVPSLDGRIADLARVLDILLFLLALRLVILERVGEEVAAVVKGEAGGREEGSVVGRIMAEGVSGVSVHHV